MAAIYLTEDDVRELLDVETAIEAVEGAFRNLAEGKAVNVPRCRARAPGIALHVIERSGRVSWLRRLESLYDDAPRRPYFTWDFQQLRPGNWSR